MRAGFKPGALFHDLYIKKHNGQNTQIDLVLATNVGLIVFEVKDYTGWIFGKGSQNQWTQVLAYGRDKYRFYNPVRQNDGHIKELRKQSKQFEKLPMFSVIVFYGSCTTLLIQLSITTRPQIIQTSMKLSEFWRTQCKMAQTANPANTTLNPSKICWAKIVCLIKV